MILRTDTYRNLEEDLATVMDTVEMYIYEQICDFDKKYIVPNGPGSDWDAFYEAVEKLINDNANIEMIDEVYVYHLSRLFDKTEQLFPLKHLLINQTPLSDFLAEYGIRFETSSNMLMDFYYKGKLITPEEILSSGHHHLLAKRLGYLGEPDYCVNGFGFWPDIKKTSDGYFDDIQRSPEIIRSLDYFLKTDMWRDYKAKTKYYGVVFRTSVDDIIFDGKNNCDRHGDKVRCLLKYALLTMHGCYFNYASSTNNPILRIEDGKSAMIDHYIEIEE